MNGFIAILSLDENNTREFSHNITWQKPFDFQSRHILEKKQCNQLYVERFTAEKMYKEKRCWQDDTTLFINEGVILNGKILGEKKENNNDFIADGFEKDSCFFRHFEGSFVGLHYDSQKNRLIAFNNPTGTKRLFYYQDQQRLIVGTDLFVIHRLLRSMGISTTLDMEAIYQVLEVGFVVNNHTYLCEISEIRAGEYLQYDEGKLTRKTYYQLQNVIPTTDDKQTIIETLDDKFATAVRLGYEMNKKNDKSHLATMNGGLDSRMTALIGYKMGYQDQQLISFSEKGYADEIIAKKIAQHYRLPIQFIPFAPDSLIDIDRVVRPHFGTVVYTTFSHFFSTFPLLHQVSKTGLVHTGLQGDTVMGGDMIKPFLTPPNTTLGAFGTVKNYPISQATIHKTMSTYDNEEFYNIYTRAFNCINQVFQHFDLIGEGFSPFLNKDFMTYAYSIPHKLRYKEGVYIDWIKTKHPDIANFTWEKIGCKPTNSTINRFFARWRRAIVKRLPIQSMWKNNMNPEQIWYDAHSHVQNALDQYFKTHLDYIADKQLQEDLIQQYKKGTIADKAQCLTVLSCIKQLSE